VRFVVEAASSRIAPGSEFSPLSRGRAGRRPTTDAGFSIKDRTMTRMTPAEMIGQVGSGLLSFPVTHFDETYAFNEEAYREHCAWLLEHDIAGLFSAGGTGEFFSLTPSELERVVRAAAEESAGRAPVIAGCGYGTAMAVELAAAAERAGADGILLFPPYLVAGNEEGIAAHIEAVCRATRLGVIVYNREKPMVQEDALARLCERNPNLVGYKDGVGDLELMARIYARMGDRLTYIGGLPTAETFALPYLEMGVTTYSSAIFNFMPDWALSFYKAVRARDRAAVAKALKEFVLPYIAIRSRGRGYAVSIVKAGMDAVGRPAGPVRTPLTPLTPGERAELKALIERQQLVTSSGPSELQPA
jgi:5-dehydro-4-deoxyglucarate dehydratase